MSAAGATWLGALVGAEITMLKLLAGGLVLLVVGAAFALKGHRVIALAMLMTVVGSVSGQMATSRSVAAREAQIPAGTVTMLLRATSDSMPYFGTHRFVAIPSAIADGLEWRDWRGPPIEVHIGVGDEVSVGEYLVASGELAPRLGRVGAREVVGRFEVDGELTSLQSANLGYRAANAVRLRVINGLDRSDRRQALLAGFLIGETSGVSEVDQQALRLAGLSHFVAVSGSNVGLFLVGWWLLLGPLATRPRRRALLGLVGILLFVLITRAEPSVLRAGIMAGLVLVGRLVGVDLDGWTVVGVTVSAVIAWSGDMATSVAFQLSVAATMGVMLATKVPLPAGGKPRRWLVGAAVATLFAQATVAPLLVLHFGAIPILAPVANVLAAPLVAVATAIGWPAALLGSGVLVQIASAPADLVLGIAEVAAGWPQLGVFGAGLLGVMAIAMVRPRLRSSVVAALALSVAWSTISIGAPPAVPTVVFLDIGQGDATLLLDPSGAVVLVDGGREPAVLAAALRRNGIRHIDLLVVTHGDADHVGGLEYLVGRVGVEAVWYPKFQESELMTDVLTDLQGEGAGLARPDVGWHATLGQMEIEVVGPLRRYASDNDGSIVLRVGTLLDPATLLLTADIEGVAQRELGPTKAEILKVPHHGSATSDLAWLANAESLVAVVSVGRNNFGHPNDSVIQTLEASGVTVLRTDVSGDVAIPISRR